MNCCHGKNTVFVDRRHKDSSKDPPYTVANYLRVLCIHSVCSFGECKLSSSIRQDSNNICYRMNNRPAVSVQGQSRAGAWHHQIRCTCLSLGKVKGVAHEGSCFDPRSLGYST